MYPSPGVILPSMILFSDIVNGTSPFMPVITPSSFLWKTTPKVKSLNASLVFFKLSVATCISSSDTFAFFVNCLTASFTLSSSVKFTPLNPDIAKSSTYELIALFASLSFNDL